MYLFNKSFFLYLYLIGNTVTFCLCFSLVGCTTPITLSNLSAKAHQLHRMNIKGGNKIVNKWTKQAVLAYCQHHDWPYNLKKISRKSRANYQIFNQARKTRVLIGTDNTLRIHFQLGGVLMKNYYHELIISPPSKDDCNRHIIDYQIAMHPRGNSVMYMSQPIARYSVE